MKGVSFLGGIDGSSRFDSTWPLTGKFGGLGYYNVEKEERSIETGLDGVMDSTTGFGPVSPGSNPGRGRDLPPKHLGMMPGPVNQLTGFDSSGRLTY